MPEFLTLLYVPLWEMGARLLLAALLAFSVGFERYAKDKPLDVRPYMLISVGACLAVLATMELTVSAQNGNPIQIDPAKVFNGIISGIGFLGAGAMFRSDGYLAGATTAASVWMMGAIGIACGLGAYPLALAGAAMALIVLLVLGPAAARTKDELGDVEDSVTAAKKDGNGSPPADAES